MYRVQDFFNPQKTPYPHEDTFIYLFVVHVFALIIAGAVNHQQENARIITTDASVQRESTTLQGWFGL